MRNELANNHHMKHAAAIRFERMILSLALVALGFVLLFLLTGCNTTTFTRVDKDGSRIQVSNIRAFWSSESYDCQLSTNGTARLTATKSNVDAAAIQAAAQGAINGMATAITSGVIKP